MTLQEFKSSGPWIRIGRRALAEKRYAAILAAGRFDELAAARDAYAAIARGVVHRHIDQGETLAEARHYVLHLCTWLDRWEEFVPADYKPPLFRDQEPRRRTDFNLPEDRAHTRICMACRPIHEWECTCLGVVIQLSSGPALDRSMCRAECPRKGR